MSRRARGEGTVLRDGETWIARIDLPPGPNGKRRRRKRRARTKTEAFAALKELQREYEGLLNPDGVDRTVKVAVATFLESQPKTGRSEHTIYLDRWRGSMITAGLGTRTIGKVTVQDCDQFLVQVRDGVFGAKTVNRDGVRRTRRLLIRVLNNEIRIGNLHRNVADLSVMPTFTKSGSAVDPEDGDEFGESRRSLTYDEFHRLRRSAGYPLLLLVELVGRNGLRPAEARALRWQCVDLEVMTITVDRQMNSRDRMTGTKTRQAHRVVPIDAQTGDCLSTWRSLQAKRSNSANAADPDLVMTTKNGTALNRNNIKRSLVAACERAGIEPVVPYELRHTAISFQIDAGHDTWQVADWAGTSVRMIEEVYRHRLARTASLGPVAPDPTEGLDL